MTQEVESWIKFGPDSAAISALIETRVAESRRNRRYTADDLRFVKELDLSLIEGDLDLSEKQLEKLRRLCQSWDIELRITGSHRRYIGPIIVFIKRLTYPLLRLLLKPVIEQQRDFNSATIALLAEVVNQKNRRD